LQVNSWGRLSHRASVLAGGIGEGSDPGVLVPGAPDQPERQRRQAFDRDQDSVVASEERNVSQRGVGRRQ